MKTMMSAKYAGKTDLFATGYSLVIKLKELEGVKKKAEGKEWISTGGIVVPEEATKQLERAKMTQCTAEVVSIGSNAFQDFQSKDPWCEVGDIIVTSKYAGKEVEDGYGNLYHIIIDSDVKAVFASKPPGWTDEEYDDLQGMGRTQ